MGMNEDHPDYRHQNEDGLNVQHSGRSSITPRKRTKCCLGCLSVFIVLAIIASIGNYMLQRSGSSLPQAMQVIRNELPIPEDLKSPDYDLAHGGAHELPRDYKQAMAILTPLAKSRFEAQCRSLGVAWPPAKVRLVGLKLERQLEVWVGNQTSTSLRLLKSYPVLAASGNLGPKRRLGDYQVPEGRYRVVHFNAESSYHLSLLLDYPNATDKAREAKALADGVKLGGSICVHGSNVSIGCLAIGDAGSEEVFTLMALARPAQRDIIILPADFRKRPDLISLAGQDPDLVKLYSELSLLVADLKDE